MSKPCITYTPLSDATPQGELNALAAIYQRAIERYDEGKVGGPATAPENAKERIKDDFRATTTIHKPS